MFREIILKLLHSSWHREVPNSPDPNPFLRHNLIECHNNDVLLKNTSIFIVGYFCFVHYYTQIRKCFVMSLPCVHTGTLNFASFSIIPAPNQGSVLDCNRFMLHIVCKRLPEIKNPYCNLDPNVQR